MQKTMVKDSISDSLEQKQTGLKKIIKNYSKVLVAFSGGIDSTLVLKEAVKTLGKENVLAVVANSELFRDEEYKRSLSLAKDLHATTFGVRLNYLNNPYIANNRPEGWYYSKKIFYKKMNDIANKYGYDAVFDGMIMDDLNDFRPGLKARDEAGAVSVLQKAKFYKKDVRTLSKQLGLVNWNKVPSCSVASRFPYNTKLNLKNIKQVMDSESFLRHQGFPVVRVRYHKNIARIEVPKKDLVRLIENKDLISKALHQYGFTYVTLDLDGFKSGRMNSTLPKKTKDALSL